MPSGSFEQDGLGWQLHKFGQRVSQWLEVRLSQWDIDLPESRQIPDWSLGLEVLGWLTIALLAVGSIWQLRRLWRGFPRGWFQPSQRWGRGSQSASPLLTSQQWRSRSRQFQQQGHYGEACRCLYLAMLAQLYERDLVPERLSLTDGECRDAIAGLSDARPYETLLQMHERHQFASVPATPEDWRVCQEADREIRERGGD